MLYYDKGIEKSVKKGHVTKEIAKLFHHAFIALYTTNDFNLFDIKKLVTKNDVDYYRLRKGKYRAIFTFIDNDFHMLDIIKRKEVYKKWP